MTVLVHVEAPGGRPDQDALGVLAALRQAGATPSAVVVGTDLDAAVAEVTQHGPETIYVADDAAFANPSPTPRVALLALLLTQLGDGYWLAPTATLTTEIAAGLSAATNAGIAWGLTGVSWTDHGLTVTRSSGNDTLEADLTWHSDIGIGLFRSHAFEPEPQPGQAPAVVPCVVPDTNQPVRIEEVHNSDMVDGPLLDAAEIIVAGGRGLGEPENLALVEELASVLGGAPGVSLPLVELGWAPRSMQVGQTGTIVAPLLYIACGISGQIQHRVGMERSGVIVAINTDANAPIMSFCDLAVVADARVIIPRLIELLREATPTSRTEQS